MRKRDLWVGQQVSVSGIGGVWKIAKIDHALVWVKPIDEVAQTFGWLGGGMVGFEVIDLLRYKPPIQREVLL